jgi:hypothetical protein
MAETTCDENASCGPYRCHPHFSQRKGGFGSRQLLDAISAAVNYLTPFRQPTLLDAISQPTLLDAISAAVNYLTPATVK